MISFLLSRIKPNVFLTGMCPSFIAPTIPNFVLSETLSISNCDNTVSILTKNLPFAVDVFISSIAHSKLHSYFSSSVINTSKSLTLLVSLSNL